MKTLHVSLKVADLGASVDFYSALFASPPSVRKPDYAKWMLDDPRVNLSLIARGDEPGFDHLGIQAETPQELSELRQRISRAGGEVDDEGQTVCCYHSSDKTWVTDGQGVGWEAFYTSGQSETFAAGSSDGCCGPQCCDEDGEAARHATPEVAAEVAPKVAPAACCA